MNAIAATIQASQDAVAAKKAAAEAAVEMQKLLYADARARVSWLIKDFNMMPMELQSTETSRAPMYDSYAGNRRDYAMLGKGLRFYLLWSKDGRTLCLALNAACRHAHNLAMARGTCTREVIAQIEASTDLLTLKELEACIAVDSTQTADAKDFQPQGHIIVDGRFAVGGIFYNEKVLPEFLCATPVEWMTRIVSGPDIAPFIVLKKPARKKEV